MRVIAEPGLLLFDEARPVIVLAHKEGVHRRQADLFVSPDIAGEEVSRASIGHIWEAMDVIGKQIAFAYLESSGAIEGPQFHAPAPRRNHRPEKHR